VNLADHGVARDAGAEAAGDDRRAEALLPQLLEQFDPFGRPGLNLGWLFLLNHRPISPESHRVHRGDPRRHAVPRFT
jgi:hypothetical protein